MALICRLASQWKDAAMGANANHTAQPVRMLGH
jgi:hypothetical protein